MQNADSAARSAQPRAINEAFVAEVCRRADADRRTVLAILAGLEPRSRVGRRVARVIAELRGSV